MFARFIALFYLAVLFVTVYYTRAEEQQCIRLIRDIKIDPNQDETIYSLVYDADNRPAMHERHVIYKSLDAGAGWREISSLRPLYREFVIAPNDSQTIYLWQNFASGHMGLKSTDSGETWNEIEVAPSIINPHDTAIMYATVPGGIRKSTDGGATWTDLKGDWERCRQVVLAPRNPQILYAYCEGGTSNGILKSINAGADWDMVLPVMSVWNLTVDPDNSEIVYAGTRYRGVYRSIDGGKQWHSANFDHGLPKGEYGIFSAIRPWTDFRPEERQDIEKNGGTITQPVIHLAIDPIHPNILYAGTISGVFKSVDSGASWRAINEGLPGNNPVNTLVINPKDSNIIYAGTEFRGIFKSIDGGENWVSANNGIACGPPLIMGL